MNILLKWKIWRIEAGIKSLLHKNEIKPFVWSFGAYYIDAKHMVFVVGVPLDSEKDKLKVDSEFQNDLRALLDKYNWPIKARNHVAFKIESEETVDRESEGNWWYHYK